MRWRESSKRLNPDGLKEIVIRVSGQNQIEVVVPEVDENEVDELKRIITTGGVLQFLIVADDESLDRNVITQTRAQADSKSLALKTDDRVRSEGGDVIGYWKGVARERDNDDLSPFRDEDVFRAILRDRATGDIIKFDPTEESIVQSSPKDGLPKVLAKRELQSARLGGR